MDRESQTLLVSSIAAKHGYVQLGHVRCLKLLYVRLQKG
jgi:hypothetical protein